MVVLTGKRRNYVINALKENGIEYKYFEMVNVEKLNELYNVLDIYIVTSRVEGGPQAILECAITKTPIISTDVGVAKEILPEESIFQMENFQDAKPNVKEAYKNSKDFKIPTGFENLEKCFMKINKISLGANIIEGPWGGGNKFFKNFHKYFEHKGIEVINHLADNDIDLIVLTDPRKSSLSGSFTHKEINLYKKHKSNVYVIKGLYECDQRKKLKG